MSFFHGCIIALEIEAAIDPSGLSVSGRSLSASKGSGELTGISARADPPVHGEVATPGGVTPSTSFSAYLDDVQCERSRIDHETPRTLSSTRRAGCLRLLTL